MSEPKERNPLVIGLLALIVLQSVGSFLLMRKSTATTLACFDTAKEWRDAAEKWEIISGRFEAVAKRNEKSALEAIELAKEWRARYEKLAGRSL